MFAAAYEGDYQLSRKRKQVLKFISKKLQKRLASKKKSFTFAARLQREKMRVD